MWGQRFGVGVTKPSREWPRLENSCAVRMLLSGAKAGAKRLWLVHYSPMITDPEEQLAQAQSIFPAAECGFDGNRITLHYEENEE